MTMLDVFTPYDGQQIESLPLMDEAAVETALVLADRLQQKPPLPKTQRIAILERTATIIRERAEHLALVAAQEGGKPLQDSRVEIERAAQGVEATLTALRTLAGQEIPMNLTPSSQGRLAVTVREPIGVVAAISAFNHPLNLIVHQIMPAIAVGCPVLVKPARATPLSCRNLLDILYEAGLPREWCQLILCDSTIAERMVTDTRVRFLSFIGSGEVGWSLRAQLAPGTHCALEHGGAAPVIVEPDADLENLIPGLVKGGYYHAGQVCVSVQRIYVHASMFDRFLKEFTNQVDGLVVGDPTDENTDVGPMIDSDEKDRVLAWIEEARLEGATVYTAPTKVPASCIAPTIIIEPPDHIRVSRQEIFGPAVCLYKYKDRNTAIERANNVPFSFQASILTKDIDIALDTAKKLRASSVMINDHTAFRADWMPFSGHRESGLGTGGIPYTMQDYTEEKLIVIKTNGWRE